jgi:hypothetical protein
VLMRSRLGRALLCSTVDVRAAALKSVLRELARPAGGDVKRHLRLLLPPMLWGHLRDERHHKVRRMTGHVGARFQHVPPRLLTAGHNHAATAFTLILSFTSWLVVGVHRQWHRSSIVDPLNVTPHTNLVRILCVVNAKCHTRSAIVVSFRPPRDANAMDPHNVNDSMCA